MANSQWRAAPCADQQIVLVCKQKRERKGAVELRESLCYRILRQQLFIEEINR